MRHVCSDRLTAWFGCGVEKKTLKRTQELLFFFLDLQVRPPIIILFLAISKGLEGLVGYTSL
jgi:hypothetical protein